MSIFAQRIPQRLLHNLLRARLNLRKESYKIFFAYVFPQTRYPLHFIINIRGALYSLKEFFCEQNTRKSNIISALARINHPHIAERDTFYSSITYFP